MLGQPNIISVYTGIYISTLLLKWEDMKWDSFHIEQVLCNMPSAFTYIYECVYTVWNEIYAKAVCSVISY